MGLIISRLWERLLVNGSESFRSVCALEISMSSPRCSYHTLFGTIPNNCSTIIPWPLSCDPFLDHTCTPWLTHGKAHFRCSTQHSILWSLRLKHRGRPSSFLSILPWSGLESYSILTPYNTAKNSFFADLFWTPSKSCHGAYSFESTIKRFWSILIDLDAQCSSSLIQVFHWKTLFK